MGTEVTRGESKSPLRRFRHDKLKLCLKKSHGEREPDRRILSQYFISSIKLTCVWRAGTKPMDNTGNINLPSESYFAAGRGLSVHIVLCFSARRQAACVQEQHSPPVQANLFPGGHRSINRVRVSWETQSGRDVIQTTHATGILVLDASSSGCTWCRRKWQKRI